MTDTCPSCGAAAAGSRFCPQCGAAVKADCRDCGSPLLPGARFCNECGRPVAAGAAPAAPRAPRLPWVVAGAATVAALAAVFLAPGRGDGEAGAPPAAQAPFAGPTAGAPAAGAAGGDPRAVDLASMTPREAADRLFNRVMENVARGDTAQARAFLPMAIGAYGRVQPLDTDARYHLASLHLLGGDAAAAGTEADAILATEPSHLFGLFLRAQAAAQRGDAAASRADFQKFLDGYETETAKSRPEYRDHAQSLPAMREEARRVVGK